MKIVLGSKSKVKKEAIEQALAEVLEMFDKERDIELEFVEVESEVAPQPMSGNEALQGAISRAENAFQVFSKEAHIAIGIENCVHRFVNCNFEYWIDFAFVVALCNTGFTFISTSSGILFPTELVYKSRSGHCQVTCGQMMKDLDMVKNSKDPHSDLTLGALSRKESLIQPLKVVLIQALS